ncbi:RNA-splicing factor [Malassezia psittaci]|uniref:RNA-splicing factor n=1 Tax=Malassezia psittaci TaxID=1821823 RepID=A0AAF0FAE7_9BASI|nr:RNA-splicing factor [Malassezia psittaci]
MYNGIGLQTARGSGTNGYVQRNLSNLKPRDTPRIQPESSGRSLEPDPKILQHDQKRKVELECVKLRDELEEQNIPEEQIEAKIRNLRSKLQNQRNMTQFTREETKNLAPSATHALGAAKKIESQKMEQALRIRSDYHEGEAFQPEIQEQRKLERREEREKHRESALLRREQRYEDSKHRREHAWSRELRESSLDRDRRDRSDDLSASYPRDDYRTSPSPRGRSSSHTRRSTSPVPHSNDARYIDHDAPTSPPRSPGPPPGPPPVAPSSMPRGDPV